MSQRITKNFDDLKSIGNSSLEYRKRKKQTNMQLALMHYHKQIIQKLILSRRRRHLFSKSPTKRILNGKEKN